MWDCFSSYVKTPFYLVHEKKYTDVSEELKLVKLLQLGIGGLQRFSALINVVTIVSESWLIYNIYTQYVQSMFA